MSTIAIHPLLSINGCAIEIILTDVGPSDNIVIVYTFYCHHCREYGLQPGHDTHLAMLEELWAHAFDGRHGQ